MKIVNRNKIRNERELFRKYFFSIASIVLIGIVTSGFWISLSISVQWWNDKVDSLQINAQKVSSIIKDTGFTPNNKSFREYISTNLENLNYASSSDYFITDLNGKVIICAESVDKYCKESGCEKHSSLEMSSAHMTMAVEDGFSEYITYSEMGFGKFILGIPIFTDGKVVAVVFAVEDAISGLIPYVTSIFRTTFFIAVLVLFVSLLSIYLICKGITNPIAEMREATDHFSKGDFKYRVEEKYKEKYLNDFAHSLNKMADDLAIEDEAQKSFVANVSHELKTPMTSIGGFIDGIRDGTIPQERQMEYLDIVSGEVKRLSRMVVSMLNLSKIESGETSIHPIEYEISSQLFETLLSFEKLIEEKNVNIKGFEEMNTVKVTADRDLIQQVIYNLLDNAVKFVDENGIIYINAYNDDKGTVVKIRNSGKGISNEEISRIFERFYKVDKSRSFDTKGVGLGLYIVKTIINMHEGDIKVSSKENEYTEFEFYIPSIEFE